LKNKEEEEGAEQKEQPMETRVEIGAERNGRNR
jgi:hypothetical protein